MKQSEESSADLKLDGYHKEATEAGRRPQAPISIQKVSADRCGVAIGRDVRDSNIVQITGEWSPSEILELLKQKKGMHIPYTRNVNFTGRDSLLTDLRGALESNSNVALTGLGGIGKTQLALEYSYRCQDDYDILWWLRSEQSFTLLDDYAQIAQRLGLAGEDVKDLELLVRKVKGFLETHPHWLLVFDNAQDPQDLKPYLPNCEGGHVIITSRNPCWGNLARALEVSKFEPSESIEFLLKRTRQEDRTAAGKLAEALGDLPLALEQAGAYMETTAMPLDEYLKAFQERKLEVLAKSRPSDYPETVATTWEISFRQVREESSAGADLLYLCAFLAPDKIPKSLIYGGAAHLPKTLASFVTDEMKFGDAIATLKRYSLMTVADKFLSIHRLVQVVARYRLPDEDRRRWAEAAVRLVDGAFPQDIADNPQTWSECSILLSHAQAASEYAVGLAYALETNSHLMNQVGIYLGIRADFEESKAALEKALAIQEAINGPDYVNIIVAHVLQNLGNVLRQNGELNRAKENYEKALAIKVAFYSPDSKNPDVASSLMNLGTVLSQMDNLDEAERSYERALSIYEEIYGPDSNHPDVALVLINLGGVLEARHNLEEAEKTYERALSIHEGIYGSDSNHPDVASAFQGLGNVLFMKGDIDRAEHNFEKSLSIYLRIYGPNSMHPDIASALVGLGNILGQKGDFVKAKENIERALEIFNIAYGPDTNHPHVAMALMNLGTILQARGDLDGSKAALVKSLTIYKEIYGLDYHNPDVALTLVGLGNVLGQKGDFVTAKEHYEKALAIWEELYGHDSHHPYVAITLTNLGNVMRLKGDLNEAKKHYEKALAIWEELYGTGSNNPYMVMMLTNLGTILLRKGDLIGAMKNLIKLIKIR